MRWFAFVLCLVIAPVGVSANTASSSAARRCDVDDKKAAAHIFANSDGKHGWHEYRTAKEVPELELGFGQFVQLWTGSEGKTFVRMEEPGEDFSAYTDYCFNKAGDLLYIRFELRTAWGWGYRKEGPIENAALKASASEFFSAENGKPIPKPEQANDVPDALKPNLCLNKSQLPFWKLVFK